jgi:hypothetical protein
VEVRRCQTWAVGWMGQHRPTHFGFVFPGSQACVRACIVMLEQHISITEHTLPVLIESCRANCLVVMRRSARIMASARFNMPGVLAVAGRPARGRSRSSVSELPDALTLFAHRPTVLLSTAQLPYTAHKRLWMLTTLSFSWTENSITARCLKRESATDAILKIHYSSAICRNDSKLDMRAGETSDFKPSKLHFSSFVNGWEK